MDRNPNQDMQYYSKEFWGKTPRTCVKIIEDNGAMNDERHNPQAYLNYIGRMENMEVGR